MGAFEMVGQVNGQGDGGDGVLRGTGTVANDNGVAESFDAHLVDPEIAEVRRGLGVVEFSLPSAGFLHTMKIICKILPKETGDFRSVCSGGSVGPSLA